MERKKETRQEWEDKKARRKGKKKVKDRQNK